MDPSLCLHSNPSTALHATLPVPSSAPSLTMATVLAPKANRTEAGVGPPADRAGATVLAGVGITECVLGMTTWRYQSHLYQPQPAHHLPPAKRKGTAACWPFPRLSEGQALLLSVSTQTLPAQG